MAHKETAQSFVDGNTTVTIDSEECRIIRYDYTTTTFDHAEMSAEEFERFFRVCLRHDIVGANDANITPLVTQVMQARQSL